jgi:hypothetical protein
MFKATIDPNSVFQGCTCIRSFLLIAPGLCCFPGDKLDLEDRDLATTLFNANQVTHPRLVRHEANISQLRSELTPAAVADYARYKASNRADVLAHIGKVEAAIALLEGSKPPKDAPKPVYANCLVLGTRTQNGVVAMPGEQVHFYDAKEAVDAFESGWVTHCSRDDFEQKSKRLQRFLRRHAQPEYSLETRLSPARKHIAELRHWLEILDPEHQQALAA